MQKSPHVPYNNAYYDSFEKLAIDSASIIVPIVVELLQPRSVIDVGCGRGAWLLVFQQHGVQDILGIDGPWVDPSKLLIDAGRFHCMDLSHLSQPIKRSDMAVCLEVAEHLKPSSGRVLIDFLTNSAPFVLFSSAIPGQGGTSHINEQWPTYWEELFAERDFVRLDPIRRRIFFEGKVAWWYRQNIFLYAHINNVERSPRLLSERDYALRTTFEWVHVDILRRHQSTRWLFQYLPVAVKRSIIRRLDRLRTFKKA